MNDREHDLHALRTVIEEARNVIMTSGLPQERTRRAMSLLTSALALTDNLISNAPEFIGKLEGMNTAEPGPEHFRQIAAKQKTKADGLPKQSLNVVSYGVARHKLNDGK